MITLFFFFPSKTRDILYIHIYKLYYIYIYKLYIRKKTKPLGYIICDPLWQKGYKVTGYRSQDNWRKHHLWVILSIYSFQFYHMIGRLFYHILTAHSPFWPIHDFKTHFRLQNLLWLKQCKSFQFQLHFLEMASLLPPYFKRPYNFALALCTVLKLMSN